jgi:plastocyanin
VRLAVLALSALVAGSACTRSAPPRAHTVTIQNFVFRPAALQVAPGDTVVWKNADFVPHTATARDSAFDSKSMNGGAEWRWVAGAAGTHPYFCVFHPNMQGTIEVR